MPKIYACSVCAWAFCFLAQWNSQWMNHGNWVSLRISGGGGTCVCVYVNRVVTSISHSFSRSRSLICIAHTLTERQTDRQIQIMYVWMMIKNSNFTMFGNKIQKMVNKENVFAVVSWCGSVRSKGSMPRQMRNQPVDGWLVGWLLGKSLFLVSAIKYRIIGKTK